MTCRNNIIYPFTTIVGQEKMKKALILNAINPTINGVLIRGEKGTAKSTAVRGLAAILPEIEEVSDCGYSCSPYDVMKMCGTCKERLSKEGSLPVVKRTMRVVDLPVGATEDRVAGTLDIQKAIKEAKSTLSLES